MALTYSIRRTIRAPRERIWALLTDAARFPEWNSTVTSIEGTIALGERLAIRVPIDAKRVFHPKVSKLVTNEAMEWSDGFAPMFRGVRTFTLTAAPGGATEFAMTERFSGLMLPLVKRSLPDFTPVFEAYATDLQRAAEEPA
ncbi:MAG: SRPBCC domain-containing protein [Kofleriaceae bacterium]